MVEVVKGDLFASGAQTLVNTVNTVGVMGKGVALEFKKRFPAMYDDYVQRCARGEVRLGQPYLYRGDREPWIVNFPTKQHWRSVSSLNDIVKGLEYLEQRYREWGIRSLAVPPLGCGNGQLEWNVVGPVLFRHLARLDIPVKLYAPAEATPEQLVLPLVADTDSPSVASSGRPEPVRLDSSWVGLAAIIERIRSQPYSPQIGRIMLQKIAYFASVGGLPIKSEFRRGSFGPFASDIKAATTRLVNNGVLEERQDGRSFVVGPGPSFHDAAEARQLDLEEWSDVVDRVADLFLRIRSTHQAEVVATVHFAAKDLESRLGRVPSEMEVFTAVSEWKQRHERPPGDEEVAETIRNLNLLGWLDVPTSNDLPLQDEELRYA